MPKERLSEAAADGEVPGAAAMRDAEMAPSPQLQDEPSATVNSDVDDLLDPNLVEEERKLAHERHQVEQQPKAVARPTQAEAVGNLRKLLDVSTQYSEVLLQQFEMTAAETAGDAENAKAKKSRDDPEEADLEWQQEMCPRITNCVLRGYQLYGISWLRSTWMNGMNAILADEMGLGKTVQTISFLSHLYDNTTYGGKYLIVAPLSTVGNWLRDFKRFCPSVPTLLYHGSDRAELRKKHFKNAKAGQKVDMPVIITTPEVCLKDGKYLEQHKWNLMVVDEGHRLKNMECKLYNVLRRVDSEYRVLLTGTPLQNNLKELFALLAFCMPDVFKDADQFMDWFDLQPASAQQPQQEGEQAAGGAEGAQAGGEGADAKPAAKKRGRKPAPKPVRKQDQSLTEEEMTHQTAEMVRRLHSILKPFVLRRIKTDVNIGLPPKQEVVLYAQMKDEQIRLTKALRDKTLTEEVAVEHGNNVAFNNLMMQLKKVCNHPTLITGEAAKETFYPSADQLVDECGKLALLDRLLPKLKARGHRVLIFSQMVKMLNVLDSYLEDRGYQTYRIDGTTKQEERQAAIMEFAEPPEPLSMPPGELRDLEERWASGAAAGTSGGKAGGKAGGKPSGKRGRQALGGEDEEEAARGKRGPAKAEAAGTAAGAAAAAGSGSGSDKPMIFLLSTRAGGLGINLVAADTVIIYDSDWNPTVDAQAMDRCHRFGQTRPVLTLRLCTARSVEDRVLSRAESKKALERVVMQRGAFRSVQQKASDTEAADLLALLNPDRNVAARTLAQSGELTDAALDQLLDRTHMLKRMWLEDRIKQTRLQYEADKQAQLQQAAAGKAGKKGGGKAGAAAVKVEEGPVLVPPILAVVPEVEVPLPYPQEGVGYEVVTERGRQQAGGLERIGGGGGEQGCAKVEAVVVKAEGVTA